MKNSTETYSELFNLVEADTKDHKLKDIATLFLNAMNDWDTYNQTNLQDFRKELKTYFGEPLTIKKIDEKSLNANNAWKIAAGNSIAEMIDVSTKFYGQSDFDKIVDSFINYYQSI